MQHDVELVDASQLRDLLGGQVVLGYGAVLAFGVLLKELVNHCSAGVSVEALGLIHLVLSGL